jgi:hypothetical protein
MERKRKPPDHPTVDSDAPREDGPLPRAGDGYETPAVSRDAVAEDELLNQIACGIGQMDYPRVPSDFLASVMKGVELKKMPWWYRVYRWAKSQHTVTITPLRIAPAAVMLLLACVLSATYLLRQSALLPSRSPLDEVGVPVTFELKMPEARSVHVVGSFNGWRPHRCEMHRTGETTWTVVLQLPAGRYEYAFLVDGATIVPDPRAEFYQDDGFGNRNNILVVGNNHETAI